MLEVKESLLPGAGKGLFTNQLFKRGEVIVEYIGETITWAECLKRNDKMDGVGAYYFFINSRKCIDAQYTLDSLARYANDAAGFGRVKGLRNNSKYEIIKGKPYIVATRNIKPGDEIFVSYGKDYWKAMIKNGYGPNSTEEDHLQKEAYLETHEHAIIAKRVATTN